MDLHQLPDNTVEVEGIEERFKVKRSTIWRKVRKYRNAMSQEPPGAYRINSRNYRFDPQVFGKWLLNHKSADQPKLQSAESREAPTRRDALNLLIQRMDGLQAGQTRMEDKLDRFIRNGRAQDGTKRFRRA